MKTFIATLVALALSGAALAAQNPNAGPVDRDSSGTRTNYAMAEDGIERKVMSNFCATWARDAYCAKN